MRSTWLHRSLAASVLGIGILCASAISDTQDGTGAALAQLVPSSARPGARPCSEAKSLRSIHSREPTKITFVNRSSTYRGLNWIDSTGQQKSYGGLNPGERKVFRTFRTHPWVVTTGPGDCLRIYLPAAEPGTVILK